MSETPIHPFRTGERYENRRGLFEVVSINGDSLHIRWDTGEIVNTSVELQAKILRNMEKERGSKSQAPSVVLSVGC